MHCDYNVFTRNRPGNQYGVYPNLHSASPEAEVHHWLPHHSEMAAGVAGGHSAQISAQRELYLSFFSPPEGLSSPMVSMTLMSGKNIAMTMLPTMTARNTIMIGSSSEVMAETALSTSSS